MPDQSPTNDPMAAFGPNEWLVDEMYERYIKDKTSVDESWWPILESYHPSSAEPSQVPSASTTIGVPPSRTDAPAQLDFVRVELSKNRPSANITMMLPMMKRMMNFNRPDNGSIYTPRFFVSTPCAGCAAGGLQPFER